ncbi:MAG: rRNA maturation RNase YbeY [Bradymonadales bacterium]|nr:MAG: rRNA maturation RNase YbeY [Bradymonadales bacterium]
MKKRRRSQKRVLPKAQILEGFGVDVSYRSSHKLRRAFELFLQTFPQSPRIVELRFVRSDEMKSLNRRFRGKNKATDVLSFKLSDSLLGSVVIDLDTAAKQAKIYRHRLDDEVLELFIHALLHLLGMDHHNHAEADLMKVYENYFIKKLKA